ncbi:MAG: DUF2809 domain-containing protein [Epulopiscium sp.]|nr:DUF2809 domain-containing protein [Candidatus Epulonipiscium sp.]
MEINKKYLFCFIILFLIESLIAIFIHDNFIRPYLGDLLVIILIYCFISIFLKKKIKLLLLYIFIFAVIVEGLQYIHILERLKLNHIPILKIVLGSTFDIKDILCYFIGMVILFLWQKRTSHESINE